MFSRGDSIPEEIARGGSGARARPAPRPPAAGEHARARAGLADPSLPFTHSLAGMKIIAVAVTMTSPVPSSPCRSRLTLRRALPLLTAAHA